jgi:hypothetical protein
MKIKTKNSRSSFSLPSSSLLFFFSFLFLGSIHSSWRERERERERERATNNNESFRDFNQIPRPPPTRIVSTFKAVQEIPTNQNPPFQTPSRRRHQDIPPRPSALSLEVHTFEVGSFYFIWFFRYVGF